MKTKYPITTRVLHWIIALFVLALFFSGWYMVDLDYYSQWYQTLPELHFLGGSILIILWALVLVRLLTTTKSNFNQPHNRLEKVSALIVKRLFYALITVMLITGYLMATSNGQALILFDQIKLPAVSHFSADQVDTMGWIHEYAAYAIMVLTVIHIAGALKHHFIDKDDTLKRML